MNELANAIMRAEAAEALLEELRRECEELRADNEELHKRLDEKEAAAPPKTDSQFLVVDPKISAVELLKGSQWSESEMRMMREAAAQAMMDRAYYETYRPPKLRRKGGPPEKDWDRKTPPQTPPRAKPGEHMLKISLLSKPYDLDSFVLEIDSPTLGARRCVVERRLLTIDGRPYLRRLVVETLRSFGRDTEPPAELVDEITDEFIGELYR